MCVFLRFGEMWPLQIYTVAQRNGYVCECIFQSRYLWLAAFLGSSKRCVVSVLPELPLPTPLPHTINNKSLLYNQQIADEARRLLGSGDHKIVGQLLSALKQTSTDHM